jgi:hypothetical protein
LNSHLIAPFSQNNLLEHCMAYAVKHCLLQVSESHQYSAVDSHIHTLNNTFLCKTHKFEFQY